MNSGYFYAPYIPVDAKVLTYTFAMLKPDCVSLSLTGTVLHRLEEEFQIKAIKTRQLTQGDVDFLYGKYKDRDFYKDLSDFMRTGCCHLVLLRGLNAVDRLRAIIGADEAKPGTIRGDYGNPAVKRENIIHASDSPVAAEAEIEHFFTQDELREYGVEDESSCD